LRITELMRLKKRIKGVCGSNPHRDSNHPEIS
jgi:hypothetical protein